MKRFFKELNFARWVMLLSLIAVLVLAPLGWTRQTRISELRESYEVEVPKLVRQVEELGRKHTQLTAATRKDAMTGQSDFESYIRKIAAADRVEVGDVNLTNAETKGAIKGVVDKKYSIKPSTRDRSFPRWKIANFLYNLESDSRRVKVTEINLELAEKRLRPHEIPDKDDWTFDAEVTSRQRTE
jgi:predicted transcriptional regulator